MILVMAMSDAETLAKVMQAVKTVETSAWGSREFGDAREFLVKVLEKDLREWVQAHPPGTADYDATQPRRAVYLYSDELHPDFAHGTIKDILFQGAYFDKVVAKVLQSFKSSARKSEKDVVAARYPEYLELLKEIRETKKAWNVEDAGIKQTHAFRMMGGLARLGSHAGSKYRDLVKRAQDMEKATVGKILTKFTQAG
jgi:hypothetical protein